MNPTSEKVLLIWFFPSGEIGTIHHKSFKKSYETETKLSPKVGFKVRRGSEPIT
tara:strand:+ start:1804 stop:1965 length:162 start_codon:yes stop_codon:yes gene_type:complete